MDNGVTPASTRRWYYWLIPRFSLRTLLITVTVFAVAFGFWVERAERQRRVAEFLTSRGVNWYFGPSRWFKPPKERDGRINHYLYSITSLLYFSGNDPHPQQAGEVVKEVARLPCLQGIKFDMRGVKQVDWRPLASAPVLTDLQISGVEYSEADIEVLGSIPYLKRLDLVSFGSNTKDISALANAKDLEELFITFFEVGPHEVGDVPKLPKLRRLKLSGVDDKVCVALAGSKTLEWLSLMGCDITDDGMAALRGLPALEQLDIGITCVGDASVETLASMPKLRTIYVNGTRFTFQGLSRLCEKGSVKEICPSFIAQPPPLLAIHGQGAPFPSPGALPPEVFFGDKAPLDVSVVTELSLPYGILHEEFFEVLPSLTSLTSLRLSSSNVTDKDLAAVAKVTSLTKLELDHTAVTSDGLAKLSSLPLLSDLSISSPADWGATVAALRTYPSLSSLNLGSMSLDGPDLEAFLGKPVPAASFEVNLNRMPLTAVAKSALAVDSHLLELHLAETGYTDEDVEFLRGYKNIRVLSLAHNRVTDKTAPILGSLQTLEALDLSDTGITDATVEVVARLPKLKLLRLNHTDVTDAGLELLAANERIEELGLRGTRITDRSLSVLKEFPNLQSLNIGTSYPNWLDDGKQSRGALSETAFAQLKDFRALSEVDVIQSELTPDHVETLKAMPQLQRLTSQGIEIAPENYKGIIGRTPTPATVRVWHPRSGHMWIGDSSYGVTADESPNQTNFHRVDATNTDEQLENIAHPEQILSVSLTDTDVSMRGIEQFRKMPLLMSLVIDDGDFGDEIVPALMPMRRLRSLNLFQSRLSKEAIEELAKLPVIRSLTVDLSGLSPDERAILRRKYPFLRDAPRIRKPPNHRALR